MRLSLSYISAAITNRSKQLCHVKLLTWENKLNTVTSSLVANGSHKLIQSKLILSHILNPQSVHCVGNRNSVMSPDVNGGVVEIPFRHVH